jgi:hypothetical protein
VVVAALALLAAGAAPARAATTLDLGTAGAFAVLAGSGITNSGESTILGDIGTSPLPTETGTGPCGTDANCVNLTGSDHPSDAVADQAKQDLTTAYKAAVGQPSDASVTGDLGGRTFTAGVYSASSSLGLTGEVKLDGKGAQDSVFIFKIGSSLVTASASTITLLNGANACNVFFQVGSAATLGSGSTFRGTILAHDDISLNDAVTVEGRLLGGEQEPSGAGAITLIHDTISAPSCSAAGTTGGASGGSTGGSSGSTTAGTTGGGTTAGTTGGSSTGGATGGTTAGTSGSTTAGTTGGSTTAGTSTDGGTPAGPLGQTARQPELPFSGSRTGGLALIGLLSLVTGGTALAVARKPKGRHTA